MYTLRILLPLALYTSATAAWPWPAWVHNMERQALQPRQDNTITGSASAVATSTIAPSTAVPTFATSGSRASGQSNTPTATATATATATGTDNLSGNETGRSNATTTTAASSSIDARLPAGGIQMLNPNPLASPSYYKIGQEVSLAWNYTSLISTPSAVDVLVTCAGNSATYTLASNMSVNATGSLVWDTLPEVSGTSPLLTETYTLIIYDAEKGPTAVPGAGQLSPYSQFRFGMYISQQDQYQPLGQFVCATCSGALSDMERQTLKFLFGMGVITVISFTWFAGGFLAYF